MTSQEKQDLRNLAQKVEDLPDEIIKRLDDRYLKKDDAPKQYITRVEGRVVNWLLGTIVTALSIWSFIKGNH